MDTNDIKDRLTQIGRENGTIDIVDQGQGSCGPSQATGDMIIEMVESGSFDDAEYVNGVDDMAIANGLDYSSDDGYFMVEFSKTDDHSMFCFLWID